MVEIYLQDIQMEHKDQRLKIINEILAGIKVWVFLQKLWIENHTELLFYWFNMALVWLPCPNNSICASFHTDLSVI